MEIERNGCKITLTDSELMNAYEAYRLECAIEDVRQLCEQRGIDPTTVDLCKVAKNGLHGLGKFDLYFEAYWDVFTFHLNNYLAGKH